MSSSGEGVGFGSIRRRSRSPGQNRPMEVSNPDKVLFPDDGITKGDLVGYYEAVAPLMVPHARGRPLTLEAPDPV